MKKRAAKKNIYLKRARVASQKKILIIAHENFQCTRARKKLYIQRLLKHSKCDNEKSDALHLRSQFIRQLYMATCISPGLNLGKPRSVRQGYSVTAKIEA